MFVKEVIAERIDRTYRMAIISQSGHLWYEVQRRLKVGGNVPVFMPELVCAHRESALKFMNENC